MKNYNSSNAMPRDVVKPFIWPSRYTSTEIFEGDNSSINRSGQLLDLSRINQSHDRSISNNLIIRMDQSTPSQIGAGWILLASGNAPGLLNFEEDIRTTKDKIEYIRDSFGISISNLSKVLLTTRPSIYSWLNNDEPREASRQRIEAVFEFAELWNEINSYHFSAGKLFRLPLGNQPSMLDRLEKTDLDKSEIVDGLHALKLMMDRRNQSIESSKLRTSDAVSTELEKRKNRRSLTGIVGSSN